MQVLAPALASELLGASVGLPMLPSYKLWEPWPAACLLGGGASLPPARSLGCASSNSLEARSPQRTAWLGSSYPRCLLWFRLQRRDYEQGLQRLHRLLHDFPFLACRGLCRGLVRTFPRGSVLGLSAAAASLPGGTETGRCQVQASGRKARVRTSRARAKWVRNSDNDNETKSN